MMLRRPRSLAPGDRVAVIAPSSSVAGVHRHRVEGGMTRLREWGVEVVEGEHLWAEHPSVPHLAGQDADRAADLLHAWEDPTVAAVVCARGGYGVQRLLDVLPEGALAAGEGKWVVGLSDVTPLLHRVGGEAGLQSIHGPVVTGLSDSDPASIEAERRLLFGEPPDGPALTGLVPWAEGEAAGPLVGGNVALLAASVGTDDLLPAEGAVVVLEDVGQPAFVLDRGLTQLIRCGWLRDVAAVVLGDFSMTSPGVEVEAVLRDRLLPLDVPVWAGGTFGHEPRNDPLVLGAPVHLGDGELWWADD